MFGVRRTKPLSTSPISAINKPIPTEIATLSAVGIALNTAILNPVRTKIRITIPSKTTRPIACAHVAFFAMETATKVLRPRPVAIASGKFATAPISMVNNPAINAVPAATMMMALVLSPPPIYAPVLSVVARISGFSATMYAIVKNVTTPPRTSRPRVDPRCVILKYLSNMKYLPDFGIGGVCDPVRNHGSQAGGR